MICCNSIPPTRTLSFASSPDTDHIDTDIELHDTATQPELELNQYKAMKLDIPK